MAVLFYGLILTGSYLAYVFFSESLHPFKLTLNGRRIPRPLRRKRYLGLWWAVAVALAGGLTSILMSSPTLVSQLALTALLAGVFGIPAVAFFRYLQFVENR